jgi:hypothetical protein
MPQGLRVKLFAQGVHSWPRGYEAAFRDDGPPARSLTAVIQPETGAGVNPVPAFRLPACTAQPGHLSPIIAFAEVPGLQLNHHLIRFEGQLALPLFGGGALIELGAQPARAASTASVSDETPQTPHAKRQTHHKE